MQKQYRHIVLTSMLVCFFLSGFAQEEKKILHAGNKAYYGGKIVESQSIYKKSLKENPSYYKANFNLGDALYKTAAMIKSGKMLPPNPKMTADSASNLVFDQAAEQFEVVAKLVDNADTAHKAWHNFGNAKLQQKNYEEAVSGYKKALRMNPKDDETRYNLAYAQRKLKEQQKNQNKDKQQNQDKQQQEKDKQKVNNPNDKDQQESQPPAMSKEQAEQMLNALKNSEKKNQDLHEKKGEGQKKNVEKDW